MNEALREHTTSIGFQLTLSKAQIGMLCTVHYFKGWRSGFALDITNGNDPVHKVAYFPQFISTCRALTERGLMERADYGWKLTKAGTLVINLLKEAGIYQERIKDMALDRVAV